MGFFFDSINVICATLPVCQSIEVRTTLCPLLFSEHRDRKALRYPRTVFVFFFCCRKESEFRKVTIIFGLFGSTACVYVTQRINFCSFGQLVKPTLDLTLNACHNCFFAPLKRLHTHNLERRVSTRKFAQRKMSSGSLTNRGRKR